jgi:DNA-binding winged helix-turn-helix (wHTH) protein
MGLQFSGCTLDIDARRLFRGANEVHLSPKAFATLRVLVEHRPRAISKAELLTRVWPDVNVAEVSVARTVTEIRKALGDDRRGRIVRTVHSHGYAFVAEVAETASTRASHEKGRPPVGWLISPTRSLPLYEGEQIIGRDPALDLHLDSPKVSRRHARLAVTPVGATIEDLGSKNGSFVDSTRIEAPTALCHGSELRVGRLTFVFRLEASIDSTETDV